MLSLILSVAMNLFVVSDSPSTGFLCDLEDYKVCLAYEVDGDDWVTVVYMEL